MTEATRRVTDPGETPPAEAAAEPAASAPTASAPAASAPAAAPTRPKLEVAFAGGVALSAAFVDWPRPTASGARDGDLRFSVLRIGTRASYGPLRLDVEWRIYPFYQFLRHAVLAYELSDRLSFDVGVSRMPFGLLPFASNSWFFGLPYYAGFEDDADFGLRAHWRPGGWDLWLAFYKNSEGSYLGHSLDSARFSYDPVQATQQELSGSGISAARNDRETNTGAVRVAYNFRQGAFAAELGGSARLGMLQDLVTDAHSPYWALAPHARLSYGLIELGLEAIAYRFQPHAELGDDERLLALGAFDAPYALARRGYLFVANLAWAYEILRGPVELVRVYVDSGQLRKSNDTFQTSRQLVLGAYALAGPIHFSVDLGLGKHHPWIGPDYGAALAAGGSSAAWHHWINVNLGFAY
jgi:hypothetical protein